jgi:hypothetical protein
VTGAVSFPPREVRLPQVEQINRGIRGHVANSSSALTYADPHLLDVPVGFAGRFSSVIAVGS